MTSLPPERLDEIEGKLEVWTDPHTHWLRRYGLELIAALREERAENERLRERLQDRWEPFATAPEDGREILAFRPDAGVMAVVFRRPDCLFEADEIDYDPCWFTLEGEDLTGDLPTIWRPYPNPFDAERAHLALTPPPPSDRKEG